MVPRPCAWGSIIFFVLVGSIFLPSSYPHNYIELDCNKREVIFTDFKLKDIKVEGNFLFSLAKEKGTLVVNLEGKDASVEQKKFSWLKTQITQRGNVILLDYVTSEDFTAQGMVNLDTDELSLKLKINSSRLISSIKGFVKAKVDIWGTLRNYHASGRLDILDGIYQGVEFSSASFNFLGKPPLLYITDSEITFKDGNTYTVEGSLNVADLGKLFSNPNFVTRKVTVDGWVVESRDRKNIGLKKDLDEQFGVTIGTFASGDSTLQPETELRCKLQSEDFFKIKMQDDTTIMGIERRKEF